MATTHQQHCGRFAPSPTGELHFGSLIAAVASYLEARCNNGRWLLRMEDLDPPREQPGAADDIIRTLDVFGFEWDGPIIYQSQRLEAYQEALDQLLGAGDAYHCACSRKEIAQEGSTGEEGPIYPGTCRKGIPAGREPRSIRVLTHNQKLGCKDRIQGALYQSLELEIGDFIIRRADGLFAYQLAVVVDDAWQGVNQVVRGADLILSTPRQLHLQSLLHYPAPGYAHIPVVTDRSGNKLSKQAKARPVDRKQPLTTLLAAIHCLNQTQPEEEPATLEDFWHWAIKNWDINRIPQQQAIALTLR
ncbi:Glutamyl-Q tRNA(Asp) synthetase [hydrothermal vent metagenome]|uniref:Glutamyl-Q tRNA(Asp) synthetase n=1 Tax=hydrothermal vent metagenome TaxID=652676 RepID=A0A3B1AN21_9ZZZZ